MKNLVSIVCLLALPALTCSAQVAGQVRQVLEPADHCRDFSADAIVTFADADLEEVVRSALSLDSQQEITCGRAAQLTRLDVPTEIERVVYGGTLRPSPAKPFENLNGIQNLVNLTSLSIINRLITDIEPIGQLTNLTSLNLHTNWFSDIGPLSNLINLTQLIISENPISDISPLSDLHGLTRLQVHGLYPYQLQHFLSFNDGRDPDVVFNGITDVSPLSGLVELRHLRIHLNRISDITPLRNLTKLTHLRLYDNQIDDISPLQDMTNLRLLWIHDNEISDITALRGMTEMLQLGLNDNVISDIGPLQTMEKLEYLFLSNNRIADLKPLANLHSLVVLRLENSGVNNVEPLSNLTSLRELGLAHNDDLYNVKPLLMNDGIGQGDELDLRYTYVPCVDMGEFISKGVKLLRVTSLSGSACPGRRLEDP